MRMATITRSYLISIRSQDSQHPTEGRLCIQNSRRAVEPGSLPYTLSDSEYEFRFNPLLDLSSSTNASSFMSGVVAAVEYGAGPEIADQIATFAFREVSRNGWVSGLSLWVILETNHVVLGEQRSEEGRTTEGECCICLEGYFEGEVITPLSPCSHRFHHTCVVPWLQNNGTCPICRRRSTLPAVS